MQAKYLRVNGVDHYAISHSKGIIHENDDLTNTTMDEKIKSIESVSNTLNTAFNDLIIDAGDSNAEIVVSRGGKESLPVRLNDFDLQLAQRTTKEYVDTLTASLTNDTPKGIYATLSDLQTAYPTGTTGKYIVGASGSEKHWYIYINSAWTDGGIYQGVGLENNSVKINKLDDMLRVFTQINIPTLTWEIGGLSTTTGEVIANGTRMRTVDYIDCTNSKTLINLLTAYSSATELKFLVLMYDANNNFIKSYSGSTFLTISTLLTENAYKVKLLVGFVGNNTITEGNKGYITNYVNVYLGGAETGAIKSRVGVSEQDILNIKSKLTKIPKLIKVEKPINFSWNAPINIWTDGFGNFQTDFNVSDYMYKGIGQVYYVNVNTGLETNDGLTKETPLKKIRTAMDKSDVKTVMIAGGDYYIPDAFNSAGLSKNINLIAETGARVRLITAEKRNWTKKVGNTNVYMDNATNIKRVFDASFVDSNGDYKELTLVASIALVDTTPNSYFLDATYIYVHTSDSRIADSNIIAYTSTCPSVTGAYTYYIEGIEFEGGHSGSFVVKTHATIGSPSIYTKRCKFKYSSEGTGGLCVVGAEYAFSQECEAAKNKNDGFNYHKVFTGFTEGFATKVIELNCVGRDNGFESDTDNGSTLHNGCKGVRLNCAYYRNKGSNVGDIDTDTQSWNLNIPSFESKSPLEDRYKSNFTAHENGEMWLDSCISFGSLNALTAQTGAKIHTRNCTLDGNVTIEGTGMVDTY